MTSAEPLPALVAVQSRLTEPNRGLRYQLLRPIVVVRDLIESIYQSVLGMMVAELRGRGDQFSSGQHLIAFMLAVAFGICAYYLSYLETLVVGAFFGLWALDRIAHIHVGAWTRDRVVTRITRDQFRWRRQRGAALIGSEDLQTRSIGEITIEPQLLVADAFGRMGQHVWRVDVVAEDGALSVPVFEAPTIAEALGRGVGIARKLGREVRILGSIGRGTYAEDRSRMGFARLGNWDIERSEQGLTATRPSSLWRALTATVERNGILFFVIIMADVLGRFGHLVLSLFGPSFGLRGVEPVAMNLSFAGLLELVTPDLSWLGFAELAFAAFMLGAGLVRGLRGETLVVTERAVSFSRAGRALCELDGKRGIEVLKLEAPRATLVFADAEGRAIAIDELDEASVAELFAHADAWLRGEGRRPVAVRESAVPVAAAKQARREGT